MEKARQFLYDNCHDEDIDESTTDLNDKIYTENVVKYMQEYADQQQVKVEPEVKVQIAKILKDLFDKYTEEKRNNYDHTEFYVGGLQDGKLVALAEIKEALSNLSA